MEKWKGRVAVVTGASAGIGAAIAKTLVKNGMTVVGIARRVEKIETIAAELKDAPGKLIAKKVDLRVENEILSTFKWIKENLKGVDVMINNAGVVAQSPLISAETENWRKIYEVNVLAVNICTREALQSMFSNKIDDGYVIHINSLSGHRLLPVDGHSMYSASKHAITVLSDALRRELVNKKSKIKVTSLSPGLTDTEIFDAAQWPIKLGGTTPMRPEDVADQIIHLLSTPPTIQITELTMVPVGMEF